MAKAKQPAPVPAEPPARPLADLLRPKTLDDVVGQRHILAPGAILYNAIQARNTANMIFYGPSGTGKTTVANIIAAQSGKDLVRLNATTAGLADVKQAIAGASQAPNGLLLYLDEIQYFNKKQQQSLLECIEDGRVQLIASTTENPYFYVYNALLSRSVVFEFKQIPLEDMRTGVHNAVAKINADWAMDNAGLRCEIDDEAVEYISANAGGDMRKAINILELALSVTEPDDSGTVCLTAESVETTQQGRAMRYDRGGDETYDLASALHKSMRGSDPDAALYYLARFLEAGDIITPSRRILACACEDVGLAYPNAIVIANACVEAANRLGLPEAQLPLAQAVITLATAPKSVSAHHAIHAAWDAVKAGQVFPVPRNLQNIHADSTYARQAQNYLYPHDYPGHWVPQQYLPEQLTGTMFYQYSDNPTEQQAKAYWASLKQHLQSFRP